MHAKPARIFPSLIVALLLGAFAWAAFAQEPAPPPPQSSQRPQQPRLPDKFTNLQVFPKDIERRALVNQMRGFAIGLGVRCSHCHEGEGEDLSKYDFAADTKPEKTAAREMLKMVIHINQEVLPKLPGDIAMGGRVRCITCHQGHDMPPPPKMPERPGR